MRHKELKGGFNIAPKEGQRRFLCRNKTPHRCPSFVIINPNKVPEDVALDYLASILVEAFQDKKEYERNHTKPKKSSDICPSVNKRAG
jgi:hypothetical protein